MVKTTKKPGGLQVNYLKKAKRKPADRELLAAYVEEWADERLSAIHDIQRYGPRASTGRLDASARGMFQRLEIYGVGHSPSAWMERNNTVAAMLLDHRSLQFGRRLQSERSWAEHEVEEWMQSHMESATKETVFRPLNNVETSAAVSSLIFALEWQRYLNKLFIRPPGEPLDVENVPFAQFAAPPSDEISMKIAELAHCRPVGLFCTSYSSDEWYRFGGREECRQTAICPNCHSRNVSRLVQRVNDGPWNTSRRQGKNLALVRLEIDTEDLGLDRRIQAAERDELGFDQWLRPSTPYYSADSGDETMIRNVDVNQSIETALTPHELSSATRISKQLMKRCKDAGMEGGLRFHSIGPKRRQFKHELAIVGEVRGRDIDRFTSLFGADDRNSNAPILSGKSIECVVADPEYSDAARLFIAGSSWKFDLNAINAKLNRTASERTHWLRRQGFEDAVMCAGLRGALAWQPLFLFSSVAFWSRYAVLKATKFKSYHPFGKWLKLLQPDKTFRTAVQRKRDQVINYKLVTENKQELISDLRRAWKKSELSMCEIARRADISQSAISRLFNEGYGSRKLAMKVRQVVHRAKLTN